MYISLNWIKDYVNLDGIDKDEIIKRFVLSTAEIEDVVEKGQDTTGIVFAKILKVANHPESQKLHILQVDKGDEVVQIVCGAPNVREGMVTALATIGGKVCGHKITKAKLVGVESFGMCCSEAELGLGSNDSGIIDVEENVRIGADIKSVWPIEDTIIEIDNKSLTNRPDLWGHYGLAREFSAIFSRPLNKPLLDDVSKYSSLPKLSINIEDKNCYRYTSISVKNICKKLSPVAIKIRLNYVGQRDINLLADLTNYVMLDLGQPMHAFDNSLVKGINVVASKVGDKLLTLEGEKHDIPLNSVLIANEHKQPIAIAGVKGGMLSGITNETNSLLLESANFNPVSIRKTSIAVGLRTDSSLRYEKSLDPNLTPVAIARFLQLLKEVDAGIVVTSCLTDAQVYEYPKITIKLKPDFISKRIGVSISKKAIIDCLKSLEFSVADEGENIIVSVPSFRATKDVSIKEDLVEEVARMFGYDNILPETIVSKTSPVDADFEHTAEYKTKRLLAEKYCVNEVHSYIWNYEDWNKENKIVSPSVVNLVDSSNSGQSGIRSNILPSLLKIVSENKNSFSEIKIEEIGRVVSSLDEKKHANEEKRLGIVVASQTMTETQVYFELKKMIENIASSVVKTSVDFVPQVSLKNYFHPVNSCAICVDGNQIGEMGLINPASLFDKKFKIGMLEVNFNKLCNATKREVIIKNVSKFQAVNLDFNFLIPNDKQYAEVEKILDGFRVKYDMSYVIKDVYENKSLGNFKSITFSYTICAKDHTLTSEEIDRFSSRLIDHMKQNGINLR